MENNEIKRVLKLKCRIILGIFLSFLLILIYGNWKYEVIAVNPFCGDGKQVLKVMTWNVHCSNGADPIRQKAIAELILENNSDFVLLNEFYQDSCMVIDSILKTKYNYTEECGSHFECGNIFYSKSRISNSGRVYIRIRGKANHAIKATIALGRDSAQIIGVHMATNNYYESKIDDGIKDNLKQQLSFKQYKAAQELRSTQAHRIKEAIVESDYPIIVMGDMNDFNCSAPLDTLTSCGLRDSWWEGGFGYGATYHDGWMRLRIDHILHSKKLKLESVKVIETDLSDHNPIVAGFSIIKN